jgi:hypothetical protein
MNSMINGEPGLTLVLTHLPSRPEAPASRRNVVESSMGSPFGVIPLFEMVSMRLARIRLRHSDHAD